MTAAVELASPMAVRTRPRRVMVVGDSMTQGGEGDWTWRYRLWQWLKSQHEAVTFVGSYTGTQNPAQPHPPQPPPLYGSHDPPPELHTTGGYALGVDSDFDSHHFSIWGRQCAQAKDMIRDELSKHPADLILVMLGFNDLGWLVSDAKGLLQSMKAFVANARKAVPHADFAIANVPQRTPMQGREDLPKSTSEYNKFLNDAVSSWTTDRSRIVLVQLCEEYEADIGSYDGLHPNALGDYQIAKAFSKTLVHDFRLGKKAIEIPAAVPERTLVQPSAFQLVSSLCGVTATWDKVYGCGYYELRKAVDEDDFAIEPLFTNRWDSHWVAEGQCYQAQVRACHGDIRSDWTPILSATAHPQLTAAPAFRVQHAEHGVIVKWNAPASSTPILQYTILWRDKDGSAFFPSVGGFKSSPAHLRELKRGHKYDVWMLTWSVAGEGLPGPTQEITVH